MNAIDPDRYAHCGCDSRDNGAALISIDDALAIIASHTRPIRDTQTCPLHRASGRVLARDVTAGSDAPPFDNAAVDGYALHTDALKGEGPWQLRVTDRILAGDRDNRSLSGLFAARIFTGAPVPFGANAVVMQEDVTRSGSRLSLDRAVKPGANIRLCGEDMRRGDLVLPRGLSISSAAIAAAAGAGMSELRILRRIRVGLVITGNEVQTPGAALSPGQIWDINTPMLSGLLTHPSIDLVRIVQIKDRHDSTQSVLDELSGQTDLIVTSGGLSVGEEDHVRPALAKLDGCINFHGVAIKPGKPVSFGRIGSSLWLGLPGNPLAAFTTWTLFGNAILRGLAGQESSRNQRRKVKLGQAIRRKAGRCELRLAQVSGVCAKGQDIVKCQDATHSGHVASLPAADGFIHLPMGVDYLPQHAMVEFLPICNHS